MLVLLSPAKTISELRPPHIHSNSLTRPAFIHRAAELVGALTKLAPADLQSLMNINQELAAINADRFASWSEDAHTQHGLPAAYMFRGEVYRGLDADSLDAEGRESAQRHIRIVSGLYGLLRPLDGVLPYRLEMGTRLVNPYGPHLYAFWAGRICQDVNAAADNQGFEFVLNLASQEYARAVRLKDLQRPVVHVEFKDRSSGRLRTISVFSKQQRGRLARYVAEHGVRSPRELYDYTSDGYRLDRDYSSDALLRFVRDGDQKVVS